MYAVRWQVIACGLIFFVGKLTFGRRVGLIGALIGACYLPAIFHETVLLAATSLYVLNLLMLACALWAARKERWYLWILPGLLLGLSALGRANVLLFLPFLLVGVFLSGRDGRKPLTRPVQALRLVPAALALLLGAIVAIAPATLHNHVSGKDRVLVSQGRGRVLTFHVGPDAPALQEYLAPLRHLLTRAFQPFRRIVIQTINEEKATNSPYVKAFRTSFDVTVDYRNVVLHRR